MSEDISFTAPTLDPGGFTGRRTYLPAHKVKCRACGGEPIVFVKVELKHLTKVDVWDA